jgi:(2Fe-2S) ferredoxin
LNDLNQRDDSKNLSKKDADNLKRCVEKLQIGKYERHILLCAGPKCCKSEKGDKVWSFLKDRLKELGFEALPVFRTKVHCLRICQNGPLMVIYPEGIWYRDLTEERIDKIIEEHLFENRPVKDWVIAENPL